GVGGGAARAPCGGARGGDGSPGHGRALLVRHVARDVARDPLGMGGARDEERERSQEGQREQGGAALHRMPPFEAGGVFGRWYYAPPRRLSRGRGRPQRPTETPAT